MDRYPLIFSTLLFAIGIILAHYLKISLLASGICLLLYLVLFRNSCLHFYLLIVLFGIFRFCLQDVPPQLSFPSYKTLCKVRTLVIKPPYPCYWFYLPNGKTIQSPYKNYFIVKLQAVSIEGKWRKIYGKSRVFAANLLLPLQRGDCIEILGTINNIRSATNPGEFDLSSFYKNKSIHYQIYVKNEKNIQILSHNNGCPILNFSLWLQRRCIERLREQLIYPVNGLAIALFLGEKRFIDAKLLDQLRFTGVMHLMAISGFHIALVAGIVYAVLQRLGTSYSFKNIFTILLLWFYAFLTGLLAPVVRATLLITIYLLAPLLGRQKNAFNALAASAWLILLSNPGQLFEAGFQFSFIACFSILLLLPKNKNKIIQAVAISIAAWLGTAPLAAYYFGYITPWGWLFSLLLSPLVFVALWSLTLFMFSPLGIGLGAWILVRVIEISLLGFIHAIAWMAQISYAHINILPPFLGAMVIFYAIVVIARHRYFWSIVLLIPLLLCGNLRGWTLPQRMFSVLDMGHGAAIYIKEGNRHFLYDCGSKSYQSGKYKVLPFLAYRGIKQLDGVILSHYDSDHYNGILEVMQKVSVKSLFINKAFYQRGKKLIDKVAAHKVKIVVVKNNQSFFKFRFLYPGASLPISKRDNQHSLLLLWQKVLFSGDLERKSATLLLKTKLPQVHIWQIPHHGAKLRNTEDLLEKLKPKIAFVNAKKGFAAPTTLRSYFRNNIKVYQTHSSGCLDFYFYQGKWQVFEYKKK